MMIFRAIVLPLSKPIMATIGLMLALSYWNNWTNGLYYLDDTSLYSIQNVLNAINNNIIAINSVSNMGLAINKIRGSGPDSPHGHRGNRNRADALHLSVLPEILCKRYHDWSGERITI